MPKPRESDSTLYKVPASSIVRFSACLVLLAYIFLSADARPQALTIDKVKITFARPSPSQTETKKLIPFESGQRHTQKDIDTKIKELKSLDFIDDIQHEWKISAEKQRTLHLHITEAKTIRNVWISGNYPFLEKEIRRILPLQSGSIFKQSRLPITLEILDSFFKKHGYNHAHFTITPLDHENVDMVDIKIRIKKGHVYRIRHVHVNGNQVLTHGRIRNVLMHFDHFKPVRLKNDLKRLKSIYAKKGYIKARVKLDRIEFDEVSRKVDLYLTVRENRRLWIDITGKTAIPRDKIIEVLDFKNRRSFDRYALRIGKERLARYYIKNGYPNVAITVTSKKTDEDVRVHYHIDAGKLVTLAKISFNGNQEFGAKKLKKQISSRSSSLFKKSPFHLKTLKQDPLLLSDFYKTQGHFDVQTSLPTLTVNAQQDQYRARFAIQEGEAYTLGHIAIQSELKISRKKLLRLTGLKPNKTWEAPAILTAKSQLMDHYQNLGYAYAEVNITTFPDHESKHANLDISIVPGPKVHVRRIIVRGLVQTNKKIVTRNIKIDEGDLFVYQKMLDAQFNLRQLGIFSDVRVKPLGFDQQQKTIDLLITLTERKTVSVNLQAGFDSRNWGRAELNFTKRNLFGLAKQFNTRFIGGLKFDRTEMTFSSPRVFGASWNLANQYFYQYEDAPQFNAHSYGSFINTLKNFGPHWTIGIKEQVIRTEVIASQSNTTLLGNALFDNTFNEFETFLIFDNRDNFSDPKKGFYILAKNELNTDITNARNNFNTNEFNISHYFHFLNLFTLNNTLRFGHTYKITSAPRIPVNKLFFLGGADTIRGFPEDGLNPAGGTVSLAYNAEMHYELSDGLKLAGFFDLGLLENNINTISINDFRESAGVGLRYFTPVGPLRLDYGMILDRRAGDPMGRLHFSFGYFF